MQIDVTKTYRDSLSSFGHSSNLLSSLRPFAIEKLDAASDCLTCFVNTAAPACCSSLNLSQLSVKSPRIWSPSSRAGGVKASREMATIEDTIVMICVKFSFNCSPRAPERMAESKD